MLTLTGRVLRPTVSGIRAVIATATAYAADNTATWDDVDNNGHHVNTVTLLAYDHRVDTACAALVALGCEVTVC